jgi:hypothetical protein
MLFTLILVKPLIKLLYKRNNFGLPSSYVTWFHSYLSSRNSTVLILGKFSSSYSVLLEFPQGSTLGSLLFNIFINDISTKIYYSNFLLFADDLKLYHVIKCVEDCKCLQADMHLVKKVVF